ncbi:MAG: UpxY family transcription antiterminator [Bacteroidales bacterium]|nr:UpxY family transcription antiterminator [Bacteroidales bacterium]
MSWFAIRVTYGRVLKFKQLLDEAGFQCFVPMRRKKTEKNGCKATVMVPAVSNLCFVNTEKPVMDDFMRSFGDSCMGHYIWDKSSRQPIIVPDKAMNDFIHVSLVMSDDILYLEEVTAKLRQGQRVRVINGPFEGIEGTVVRIRRSRRILVELPGMLAVATTYVQPADLEIL